MMDAIDCRPARGAELVLVGRSNVGKSTIMRELTGHDVETGRKPGVTRRPNHFDWTSSDFMITDLPGFGFMQGVDAAHREAIKTGVVRYLETFADTILVAVLVVDGNSAVEIIDRHRARGEVPHDVELFSFLTELDIPTVVAVNKMDRIDDRDATLDAIAERLGLHPPWQQWPDIIAPITAKRGAIDPLRDALRTHLSNQHRDDLLGHVVH